MESGQPLIDLLRQAFPDRTAGRMSLQDGCQVDSYETNPLQYEDQRVEIEWQAVSDATLETYYLGLHYLDGASWVGYLPALLRYALEHPGGGEFLVTETLLFDLRPASVHEEAFKRLPAEGRLAVNAVLEFLALDPRSAFQHAALQVIQELDDSNL